MKTRRSLLAIGVILLTLVSFQSQAFSWGWAVHAYVDDHLGKKRGLNNLNEIYGGMVPDLFNNFFELPDLSKATHQDFLKMWDAARCRWEKPVPFGFVSHNESWGADFTAHNLVDGYVIMKAKLLLQIAPLPDYLNIDPKAAELIYHGIVENAVDVLMKRLDPAVGHKMTSSALLRSPETPFLLIRAYAKDFAPYFGGVFEAAKTIRSSEREFRKGIMLYGHVLTQDEETAIQLLSGHMVDLAESFLGEPLPLDREVAISLVADLTNGAMLLCQGDFAPEVDATIQFVDEQLDFHGIAY